MFLEYEFVEIDTITNFSVLMIKIGKTSLKKLVFLYDSMSSKKKD